MYYNRYDLVRSYTHIYRVKSVYNDCIHVGWGRAARARRGARGAGVAQRVGEGMVRFLSGCNRSSTHE